LFSDASTIYFALSGDFLPNIAFNIQYTAFNVCDTMCRNSAVLCKRDSYLMLNPTCLAILMLGFGYIKLEYDMDRCGGRRNGEVYCQNISRTNL